jgi:ATP-dependent Clp protease ATP-binding subunit ClpC
LFETLLGQDEALNQILRNLEIVDAEIVDPQRPALSMLLCGPTGTGKTETCKIIAKNFYGSEDNIVKVNMGEYSTEQDVSKLSGSAPGLVGYDDEPQLIKEVRQKPNSVVVFDEIEKAHPSVQKILLNILDNGEMRDNKGNKISFRNNIIVFTTNLGCTHDTGKAMGMGLVKTTVGSGKNDIMKAIKNYFSPEFLGRLDDIVYYESLTKDVLNTLVDRYFNEYVSRSTKDLVKNLELTEDDREAIFKEANVETQGARGVRKAVQKKIAELYQKKKNGEQIDVDAALQF